MTKADDRVAAKALNDADAGSRGGDPMMAKIGGVMKLLHRNVERVFDADRQEIHCGKRKLKRDQ
jgi:hypothetical protein